MTRDDTRPYGRDHRPRGRLAPSPIENQRDAARRRNVPPAPEPDPEINLSDVIEGSVYDSDAYNSYDPDEANAREQEIMRTNGSPRSTNGNGHQINTPYDANGSFSNDVSGSQPAGYPNETGSDPFYSAANELSRQEQYLLLMHTIQLYDDDWRLAQIRTSSKKNWLVAFLTPRKEPMDLQQAMKKQIVLRITVDSRGNTDVTMPKKRGLLGRLLNWLRGS